MNELEVIRVTVEVKDGDKVHVETKYVKGKTLLAVALRGIRRDIETDERIKEAWELAAKMEQPDGMN